MKNITIESLINQYTSCELSILPTSLLRLDNLSELLEINLYCKRDDLTGFAFGGNKTRKLDYLMSDAQRKSADCIVTFGSNQSNWCRMTSAAATASGMDVFLILDGKEPDRATGNLILDNLVGANIEYVNCDDPDEMVRFAQSKTDELRQSGRNPYYLPVGGSTPIGTLGYINAFRELMSFSSDSGIEFNKIFVASGSAGTQAGLVCGQIIHNWKGELRGISVGREKGEQEALVAALVAETFEMLDYEIIPSQIDSAVIVDDEYYGEGYRINTTEAEEAIKLFARYEGIFLDEVYTGKAAAGLVDSARRNQIKDSENILFIHTGGGVQLFE